MSTLFLRSGLQLDLSCAMAAPNGEAGNGLATEHTTSPTWSSPQLRTVTVTRDALSFSDRQTTALTELDRRMYSELRRRQRDWQYSVQRARSGFLRLLPADVSISSSNTAAPAAGNKTSSLQSSADIVPVHKVRAQYFEHVDDDANDDDDYDASHDPSTRSKRDETQSDDAAVKSRGRYQIRFDVSDFAPSSVSVIVEGDAIVVRATRSGPLLTPCHRAVTHDDSPSAAADDSDRLYLRRVAKPDAVDRTRIQAVLSADGILTVEAPVSPPTADGRHHHHQQQLDTVGCTAAETGKAVSKKAGDLNGVTVEIEEGIDSTLKTADKDDSTLYSRLL